MFFLTVYGIGYAQNVSFSYDNAGNRIKREIILQRKFVTEKTTNEYYSEMLSEKIIRIYPNPTDGMLKVKITGLENREQCVFKIFNSLGQLIISKQAASSTTDIDISGKPNGTYILQISLNGEKSAWKIIKQ